MFYTLTRGQRCMTPIQVNLTNHMEKVSMRKSITQTYLTDTLRNTIVSHLRPVCIQIFRHLLTFVSVSELFTNYVSNNLLKEVPIKILSMDVFCDAEPAGICYRCIFRLARASDQSDLALHCL